MLISHAATSSTEARRPRSGPRIATAPSGAAPCDRMAGRSGAGPGAPGVAARPASTAAARVAARLRVDILHLALRRHLPCLDRVVVVGGVAAVRGDARIALGLGDSGVIGGAALENGRGAVPPP